MPDREMVVEGLEMSYRYSNVDEDNTLVPQQLVLDILALLKEQEPVVRCRDCKHRPIDNRNSDDMTGFAIKFPDGKCPCQCEDGWYNWYPDDDWFCAYGEREKSDG